jgi:hypothetical protein
MPPPKPAFEMPINKAAKPKAIWSGDIKRNLQWSRPLAA